MSARTPVVWILGAVLALSALGLALIPLETAAFTRALSTRYSLATEAGITTTQAVSLAEGVRAYVVDGTGTLPRISAGSVGFDESAISHLDDVRAALRFGKRLTLGLLVLAAAGLALVGRLGGRGAIARALGSGALLTVLLVVSALTMGVFDFERLFAAFHSLFFSAGTWTFPYESLLIRLFPEPFWLAEGAAWGLGTLLLGGLFGLGWGLLRESRVWGRAANQTNVV